MLTKEVAEAIGGLKTVCPTGTSVLVEGELTPTPEGTKQVGDSRVRWRPVPRQFPIPLWEAGHSYGGADTVPLPGVDKRLQG